MRVMAIDYGDARTGVAISDPTGMLAGWTTTLHSWNRDEVVQALSDLVRERGVDELVLGCPKNMNGTAGDRMHKSEELAEVLRVATGLPVTLWDERLTTVDAHRILSENGRHGKRRKETVDAVAATLILEGYLARRRQEK